VSRVRVCSFSVSIDGYGAGPNQSLENPIGVGGMKLHEWMIATRTFKSMFGKEGGTTGTDDEFAKRGFENVGAWILGRNMFGPVRGPWPDESWKGWWGDNPPYHTPVFVLTHHARNSITMEGGTVFHFVTDGINVALERALKAADGKDVRIGGGVVTIRQYLEARLIDEFHLAVSPVLLGTGENLLVGLDYSKLGYECSEHVATNGAMHCILMKRSESAR
jgi:dihydrofolate reductase